MSTTKTSPKLSPVILEAMARTLSDHDLLRFMLSSKEAFNATLDALSTVEYVNYHDQNFEEEPCISFRMRGDNNRKITLNYITHSNPLFDFVVNSLKHRVTKVEIGELVAIKPWVLNAFISTRLVQLSLGVVLPKDVQKCLKHALNLTEIRYSSFDIFVANGYTAMQATKVIIDYIDFREIEVILPKSEELSFYCLKKVEELVIGEEKIFIGDYDIDLADFWGLHWEIFMEFLKFFPSLKSFEIHLSGSTRYPFKIFKHFVFITYYICSQLPLNTKGRLFYDIMVPPHEWIAIAEAIIKSVEDRQTVVLHNKIKEGIKKRYFPSGSNACFWRRFHIHKVSEPSCELYSTIGYYCKLNEYDFDAENNQEYQLPSINEEYFGVSADEDFTLEAEASLQNQGNNVQPVFYLDTDSDITTNEDLDPVNFSVFNDNYEPESVYHDTLNIHTFYDTDLCLSSDASDFYENCTNDTCETETYGSDGDTSTLSIENSTYDDSESQARGIDNDMIDNLSESNETTCKSDYDLESTQSSLTDDKDGAD